MKKFKNLDRIEWIIIFLLIVIPILIGIILPNFNVNNGSDDGWLGFWGGYLGAIIAVVGVWWQTNKTIEIEKKKSFIMVRPFANATVSTKDIKYSDKVKSYYTNESVENNSVLDLQKKYNGNVITISNLSDKPMIRIYIKLTIDKNNTESACVNIIKGGEEINVVSEYIEEKVNSNSNLKYIDFLESIEIVYQTTRRESAYLLFKRSKKDITRQQQLFSGKNVPIGYILKKEYFGRKAKKYIDEMNIQTDMFYESQTIQNLHIE